MAEKKPALRVPTEVTLRVKIPLELDSRLTYVSDKLLIKREVLLKQALQEFLDKYKISPQYMRDIASEGTE